MNDSSGNEGRLSSKNVPFEGARACLMDWKSRYATGRCEVDFGLERNRINPLTQDLMDTDSRYFEIGAEQRELLLGRMCWVPGCTEIAPGCVLVRTRQVKSHEEALQGIAEFEEEAAGVEANLFRLYVQEPNDILEERLARRGYVRRQEVAFVSNGGVSDPDDASKIKLREITSQAEMDQKSIVDRVVRVGPDGHVSDPERWHDCLCRKWMTGELKFYLIEYDGTTCGSLGEMETAGLVRLKNLVVHPDFRRRGIGKAAALMMLGMAGARNRELGVFGTPGGGGFATYTSVGLPVAGVQHEWWRNRNE